MRGQVQFEKIVKMHGAVSALKGIDFDGWFDIGREYTERWLHQQQIRDAVGAPGLTGRAWLHPTLDIFVRALPHTFRHARAAPGSSVRVEIEGEAGGVWTVVRSGQAAARRSARRRPPAVTATSAIMPLLPTGR